MKNGQTKAKILHSSLLINNSTYLVAAGSAAGIGRRRLAAALSLAVARAFVELRVFIGAGIFVGERAHALGLLRQLSFGLRVFQVEQWVMAGLAGGRVGLWLCHTEGTTGI
jgi:hypothetical protein